jgi:hypothetical protein
LIKSRRRFISREYKFLVSSRWFRKAITHFVSVFSEFLVRERSSPTLQRLPGSFKRERKCRGSVSILVGRVPGLCDFWALHAGFWAQADPNRKKAGRGMCVDMEMISGTWSEIKRVSDDTAEFGKIWFQMVLMNTLSMR